VVEDKILGKAQEEDDKKFEVIEIDPSEETSETEKTASIRITQEQVWKIPLKKKEDRVKFEEGTYRVLFKNDGDLINGRYNQQLRFDVEGWNIKDTTKRFSGVWYVTINDFEGSLYGQLQRFRGDTPLSGRLITLQVVGSGTSKRYKILELGDDNEI